MSSLVTGFFDWHVFSGFTWAAVHHTPFLFISEIYSIIWIYHVSCIDVGALVLAIGTTFLSRKI